MKKLLFILLLTTFYSCTVVYPEPRQEYHYDYGMQAWIINPYRYYQPRVIIRQPYYHTPKSRRR